ncbi:MAG: DUF962 domain-containing protein [Saprospiraceae bacterium]|nr:DUF962 domain-containing protein [Saprospiraceae bacterium]
MKKLDVLLNTYGESHQNTTNKLIHWICVPAIMFSLVGLVMQIPFPIEKSLWIHWASILLGGACLYYFTLSKSMAIGFIAISLLLIWGNFKLDELCEAQGYQTTFVCIGIFVLAWIGQFIGHGIEGKKPSFLQDIEFLLIGPAWLLHFIYKKINLPY